MGGGGVTLCVASRAPGASPGRRHEEPSPVVMSSPTHLVFLSWGILRHTFETWARESPDTGGGRGVSGARHTGSRASSPSLGLTGTAEASSSALTFAQL